MRSSGAGTRAVPLEWRSASCASLEEHAEKYFVFSSGPAIVHAERVKKLKSEKAKLTKDLASGYCEGGHAKNLRTRGAHEFYNVMWDPSVYRGNSFKTTIEEKLARCRAKRNHDADLVKKRKYPRFQRMGGIRRPTVHETVEKHGFTDMGIQTEKFLEELTSDNIMREMCTQMERSQAISQDSSYIFKPYKMGSDDYCQTETSICCPFNKHVKSLGQCLSEKILEQSILEEVEDAELEAIRKIGRKFLDAKRLQLAKAQSDIEAQKIVGEERERAMVMARQEARAEADSEIQMGAQLFASRCITSVTHAAFNSLKQLGFMSGTRSKAVEDALMPSINEMVTLHLSEKKLAARLFLDAILLDAASKQNSPLQPGQESSSLQRSTSLMAKDKQYSYDADYSRNADDDEYDYYGRTSSISYNGY